MLKAKVGEYLILELGFPKVNPPFGCLTGFAGRTRTGPAMIWEASCQMSMNRYPRRQSASLLKHGPSRQSKTFRGLTLFFSITKFILAFRFYIVKISVEVRWLGFDSAFSLHPFNLSRNLLLYSLIDDLGLDKYFNAEIIFDFFYSTQIDCIDNFDRNSYFHLNSINSKVLHINYQFVWHRRI